MDLVMDRRIVWDRTHMKEVDEAKNLILSFKRQGHDILLSDGRTMERFNPSFEEVVVKAKKVARGILKILDVTGDERIVWDREKGLEAMQAKKKFNELIDKGYKAYSVDSKGNKKTRIEEFDVDSEEIIMVPATIRG